MQLPTEGYILAGLLLAGVWIVSTELGRQFAIWFGEKNCYFLFKRTRPTFLLAYPLTFVATAVAFYAAAGWPTISFPLDALVGMYLRGGSNDRLNALVFIAPFVSSLVVSFISTILYVRVRGSFQYRSHYR
ncbi:MAG: hypothetical protein UY52_C0019G0013 [Parcubacteria group bacterium GW2011_GWC2_49_9]|nr:MAG: hypothetical protein UY52_C0019G0013 [Parcubacteria group bacterium GW2011_GWC2_49_9]